MCSQNELNILLKEIAAIYRKVFGDDIVKIVRFDGWQATTEGKRIIKQELRKVIWVKYKIKDQEVFDKAYSYIEQYY